MIVLTVISAHVPFVTSSERAQISDLGNGFYRIQLHFGFREAPDIPAALAQCSKLGMDFNMLTTSFFLSRETLIVSKIRGMAPWREKLFVWMSQNAESAMTFFKLPVNRVLELGTQIEI